MNTLDFVSLINLFLPLKDIASRIRTIDNIFAIDFIFNECSFWPYFILLRNYVVSLFVFFKRFYIFEIESKTNQILKDGR
jgi:hypothetical protein